MNTPSAVAGSPLTRPSLLVRIRDLENHRAWEEFVEIYTPLVYGYCRKSGLQDADAADVAQEVMRAVARAIPGFEYDPERARFRQWLFTVVRNKLRNSLASQRRHPNGTGDTAVHRFLEEQPAPEEQVNWDQEYDRRLFHWAAEQVHAEFKERTWQAFWLTAVEGQSGQAVSQSWV